MPYPHMPVNQFTFSATQGSALYAQPMYSAGVGLVLQAKANAMATSVVIGMIAATSVAAGAATTLLVDGDIATQSTALWDAIAGTTGGLAAGTIYYLSPSTAGRFTATKPVTAGQTIVPVLFALSTTTARVLIATPIQL